MRGFLGVEGIECQLGSWYGYQRLLLVDPEMQAGGTHLSSLPNEYIDRFVMRCWLRSSLQKQAADLPWTVQLKDTILYLTLMGPFDCREFPSTYSQILKVARKRLRSLNNSNEALWKRKPSSCVSG